MLCCHLIIVRRCGNAKRKAWNVWKSEKVQIPNGVARVTQFFCMLLKAHKVDLLFIYVFYLCLLFLFVV